MSLTGQMQEPGLSDAECAALADVLAWDAYSGVALDAAQSWGFDPSLTASRIRLWEIRNAMAGWPRRG